METSKARKRGAVILYSPETKAEFLLSNAVDSDDYAAASDEVRKMGLKPGKVKHYRSGVVKSRPPRRMICSP